MSGFRRRALEAWRTRGQVTYGPRLSDDPRYAAMRAGQLTHPDAHEFGPVTLFYVTRPAPAVLEAATVG